MATTTKYKPYPKMKPAGVDWIGKIPAEWNVEYMKNLGRFESSGIDKKIVEIIEKPDKGKQPSSIIKLVFDYFSDVVAI